jgi:hypothetical protein
MINRPTAEPGHQSRPDGPIEEARRPAASPFAGSPHHDVEADLAIELDTHPERQQQRIDQMLDREEHA